MTMKDEVLARDVVLTGMKWTQEDGTDYVYLPAAGGCVIECGYNFAEAFLKALKSKRGREKNLQIVVAQGRNVSKGIFCN